jgi:hypothetical protein
MTNTIHNSVSKAGMTEAYKTHEKSGFHLPKLTFKGWFQNTLCINQVDKKGNNE